MSQDTLPGVGPLHLRLLPGRPQHVLQAHGGQNCRWGWSLKGLQRENKMDLLIFRAFKTSIKECLSLQSVVFAINSFLFSFSFVTSSFLLIFSFLSPTVLLLSFFFLPFSFCFSFLLRPSFLFYLWFLPNPLLNEIPKYFSNTEFYISFVLNYLLTNLVKGTVAWDGFLA